MNITLNYTKQKEDYFTELKKFHDEKVAIRKGCPNRVCHCTGICQEIVGWRDKTEEEKRDFIY